MSIVTEKIEKIKTDIFSQLRSCKTLDYNQLTSIYQKYFPKTATTKATEKISRIVSDMDRDGELIAEFDKRLDVNRVSVKNNN